MHVLKKILGLSVLALTPITLCAAAPADLGAHLTQRYIQPAMGELQRTADALGGELNVWCAKPDGAGAGRVQAAFTDLAQAWARVEFLRFGPLVQANRFERMAFWPDTRGVMPRQVQALLMAQDEALLAPGELAGRSVAVQGLPALEYVLFGEPAALKNFADPAFPYACRYAQALTANVAAISRELVAAWGKDGDYGGQFMTPAAANDLYRSQQEVAAEAVKALSTGLQFARDVKIMPVLGVTAQDARPKRAAFWRSGLSYATLAASLDGLHDFYLAGGYELPANEQWISAALSSELRSAARGAVAIQPGLEQAVASPDGRRQLELAALTIKNAKNIVDQHLAPALGVTIGFNALDGD